MVEDDAFDAEIEAVGSVLKVLAGLSGPARERVIEYVMRALSIRLATASPPAPSPSATPQSLDKPEAPSPPTALNDIRSLRESKQPNSANQMAALAAYYLSEMAPEDERSDVIDSAQLDRLFRQAGFPLPQRIGMTLPNATQAGYFDSTGETGKYRLNPVGYNLVVHGLPSSGEGAAVPRRRSPRKASTTKAASKRASAKKATTKKATTKKAAPKKS